MRVAVMGIFFREHEVQCFLDTDDSNTYWIDSSSSSSSTSKSPVVSR